MPSGRAAREDPTNVPFLSTLQPGMGVLSPQWPMRRVIHSLKYLESRVDSLGASTTLIWLEPVMKGGGKEYMYSDDQSVLAPNLDNLAEHQPRERSRRGASTHRMAAPPDAAVSPPMGVPLAAPSESSTVPRDTAVSPPIGVPPAAPSESPTVPRDAAVSPPIGVPPAAPSDSPTAPRDAAVSPPIGVPPAAPSESQTAPRDAAVSPPMSVPPAAPSESDTAPRDAAVSPPTGVPPAAPSAIFYVIALTVFGTSAAASPPVLRLAGYKITAIRGTHNFFDNDVTRLKRDASCRVGYKVYKSINAGGYITVPVLLHPGAVSSWARTLLPISETNFDGSPLVFLEPTVRNPSVHRIHSIIRKEVIVRR